MIVTPKQIIESLDEAHEILRLRPTVEAYVLIGAIGFQESEFEHRRQVTASGAEMGPAMGFYQFEKGGGVRGVLRHEVSKERAVRLCEARGVNPVEMTVWQKLRDDDVLAAGFARLLLLTDATRLPPVPDAIGFVNPQDSRSWRYYERNWRPGKPHPQKWKNSYAKALGLFNG